MTNPTPEAVAALVEQYHGYHDEVADMLEALQRRADAAEAVVEKTYRLAVELDRLREQAGEHRDEYPAFSRMWDKFSGQKDGLQMALMEMERTFVGQVGDQPEKAIPALAKALDRLDQQDQPSHKASAWQEGGDKDG